MKQFIDTKLFFRAEDLSFGRIKMSVRMKGGCVGVVYNDPIITLTSEGSDCSSSINNRSYLYTFSLVFAPPNRVIQHSPVQPKPYAILH